LFHLRKINNASVPDLTVNYCGVSSVSFVVAKGEGNARTCEKVEETDTHLDVLHPLVRSYRGLSRGHYHLDKPVEELSVN
ncbi:hypothetical protein J6590_098071, partial [Homalodisca vitripennis]